MPISLLSRLAVVILLLLLNSPGRAQVVALDPAIQGQPLGPSLSFWVDESGRASLADVLDGVPWQHATADIPNFGFSRKVYWVRLNLQAANLQEPWLLEVAYNLLDEVRFFVVDDSGQLLQEKITGMRYPDTDIGPYNRFFVLPLPQVKAGQLAVYLRVRSDHAVHLPLYLWKSSDYVAHSEQVNIALGMFFGTFGILLLYNFFLYTLSRDSLYLVYSGLTLALIFFHAQLRSLGVRLLLPQWVEWNGPLVLLSSLLATYMLALHAERFLQLEQSRFPLKRFYVHLRWMCLVTGVLILWSRSEYGLYLMVALVSLTTLVTFFAVLYCYRGNDRPLRWFAMAWILFFLSIMPLAANKVAVLPFNFYTDHAISVSALVGMLLISMAMSDQSHQRIRQQMAQMTQAKLQLEHTSEQESRRLRNDEMERTAAEISLRLQSESNERLLREMDGKEQEIEEAVRRLREAARIDTQTTLFNRSYFNQRLKEEFERAIRSQQRLSLIFVSVSRVDEFIQRYGFKAGDEVVRQTAEVVDSVTRHHCGSVYRYEEEIFAVILPGISVHRAQAVAEMIRAAFDNQPFLFAGQLLDVTVSVGVGSLMPHMKLRPESLVADAESALQTARAQQTHAVAVIADRMG